jgi:O-antigen/teichoic acid export membrane protein
LLAIGLYRFKLRGPWRLDLGLQRAMFGQSYPLMLNHLLATIFFFIDIPLLQQFKGDEAVGWYDSAYKYVKAFNIIPSFFTIALFPVISRQISHSIDDARRTFRMSVKLLLLVALPLASLTTVIAPLLIGALGGAAFLPDGALALRLMVWSIPFGWVNSVTNYVLIALGQERLQTRAFAAGVGFNLIANIIFIPLYSYRAAAVTTILSEIVLLVIFNIYLLRKMPDIGWVRLLRRPIAVSAIMVLTMILLIQVHWLVAAVGGLAVYGAGLFLFRIFGKEEKQILSNLLPEPVAARLRLVE